MDESMYLLNTFVQFEKNCAEIFPYTIFDKIVLPDGTSWSYKSVETQNLFKLFVMGGTTLIEYANSTT